MSHTTVESVEITPTEFEKQVRDWLEGASEGLRDFGVTPLKKLEGPGGEYEIDAVAKFEVLGGASIVVLVECKYYSWNNPVKRDVVMLLHAKMREVGAHKGMVFSTSPFQRGALKYAKAHGIATILVQDGKASYETKDRFQSPEPPPWRPDYKYIGRMLTWTEGGYRSHLIADDYHDAIQEWFKTNHET